MTILHLLCSVWCLGTGFEVKAAELFLSQENGQALIAGMFKAWHVFSHYGISTHHLLPETLNHPSSWIRSFKTRSLLFRNLLSPPGGWRAVRAIFLSYLPDLEFCAPLLSPLSPRLLPWQKLVGTQGSDGYFPCQNPRSAQDQALWFLLLCAPAQPWKCHSVRETSLFLGAALACSPVFPSRHPGPQCFEVAVSLWVKHAESSGNQRGLHWVVGHDAAFSSRAWPGWRPGCGRKESGFSDWLCQGEITGKPSRAPHLFGRADTFLRKNLYTVGFGGAYLWS